MVDTLYVLRSVDHVFISRSCASVQNQARTLPVAYDRRRVTGARSKEGDKRRTRMTMRRPF